MNSPINFLRRILNQSAIHRPKKLGMRLGIVNLTQRADLAHSVGVADHADDRRKGLLGRKVLPPGEGLWIVPCKSVHTIGMHFAIDLVYLDRDKRVTKVRSEVAPWRLSGCLSAHSVLELPSGTIRRSRTRPGDKLAFFPASSLLDAAETKDPTDSLTLH